MAEGGAVSYEISSESFDRISAWCHPEWRHGIDRNRGRISYTVNSKLRLRVGVVFAVKREQTDSGVSPSYRNPRLFVESCRHTSEMNHGWEVWDVATEYVSQFVLAAVLHGAPKLVLKAYPDLVGRVDVWAPEKGYGTARATPQAEEADGDDEPSWYSIRIESVAVRFWVCPVCLRANQNMDGKIRDGVLVVDAVECDRCGTRYRKELFLVH